MPSPSLALLSDLDGTLIDSRASVRAAFHWWIAERGLDESLLERIPHGRTSTDAVSELAPQLDAQREGEVLDRRQTENTDGVVALDGAQALLEGPWPIAVVTSCSRRLALARIAAAGLPTPRVLLTHEDWTQGKPHPEPYLNGARRLGAAPQNCIVLEDAPAGVEAGVRAGMRVIAVLTAHEPESLPGAFRHVRTPAEIPALLRSL